MYIYNYIYLAWLMGRYPQKVTICYLTGTPNSQRGSWSGMPFTPITWVKCYSNLCCWDPSFCQIWSANILGIVGVSVFSLPSRMCPLWQLWGVHIPYIPWISEFQVRWQGTLWSIPMAGPGLSSISHGRKSCKLHRSETEKTPTVRRKNVRHDLVCIKYIKIQ